MKKNPYHFNNKKEFNEAVNRKFKPLIDEEVKKYQATLEQAKIEATEAAIIILLPVVATALNESLGIGEKRFSKFIKSFEIHLECVEEGVTDLDQYKEYCKQKAYKLPHMEVEE